MDLPGEGEVLVAVNPTAEQQLTFLQHLQHLFEEGDFVATYKYALLISLAELAVEFDPCDAELAVPVERIAEKFAELYWAQTVPYSSGQAGTMASVLLQNQGNQAAVVNALLALRAQGAATFAEAKQLPEWPSALREIARTVTGMPVQYLQNVGGAMVPFLYEYPHPPGRVVLKAGVSHMLRTFHPLIQQLSRAGWIRHVRRNRGNAGVIGRADDLEQFMFGSSRSALSSAVPVLSRIQSRRCFYCGGALSAAQDVDHFIPWSKYPRDLAHNLVLAHVSCNRNKSDLLAAERHLVHWVERNERFGSELAEELSSFVVDAACTRRVARWAYELGVASNAVGWVRERVCEPLVSTTLNILHHT